MERRSMGAASWLMWKGAAPLRAGCRAVLAADVVLDARASSPRKRRSRWKLRRRGSARPVRKSVNGTGRTGRRTRRGRINAIVPEAGIVVIAKMIVAIVMIVAIGRDAVTER